VTSPSATQPERENAVDRLRKDRDRFVAFAFAGADILIELDADGAIRFTAGALALIGRSTKQQTGTPFVDLVGPYHRTAVQSFLDNDGGAERKGLRDISLKSTDGSLAGFRMTGYRLADMDDHFFISLARREVAAPAAGKPAHLSDMPGVMPSDGFTAAASQKLADPNTEMSLIEFAGLDALGSRVGPEEIAMFMRDTVDSLRAKSVDGGSVAALGSERLGVIHDRDADIDAVNEAAADRARMIDPEGLGITVDRTEIDLGGAGLDEGDAIRALVYTINQFAKSGPKAGLNSLRDGYEAMLQDTLGRMEAFRSLVSESDFDVVYQPIVSLSDRKTHHYEALVRFGDAEQSPYDLITFAEDLDMITSFDRSMCQRIIDLVSADDNMRVPIAVNLSAKSIESQEFLSALDTMLANKKGLSRKLMFEITESYEIADLAAANQAIQALRNRGFRVCLDDFGVGATNFDYLRTLQVDYVKIDGSYVRSVLSEPQAKAFLKAIVHLCDDLRIQTIAEFVEDEATARFLRANRVRYGQGYLFGKPTLGLPSAAAGAPVPA
jgi:EAL domain-containing protein (putative c-di-GMP-specific phosphodiesterase class I)